MKKLSSVLVVALILSFCTLSCATIVSHTSSVVGIDTQPQGATVTITDRQGVSVYSGQTPATIRLKNGNGFFKKGIYEVRLTMEGYQPSVVTLRAHLNGWYFGNVLFGGFIGLLIVDPATGAMYSLKNQYVDEKLVPKATGAYADPAGRQLKILSLKDIPQDLRKDLVKLP